MHQRKRKQLGFLLLDLLLLYASLYLVLVLRYGPEGFIDRWLEHTRHFSFAFIAWILCFYTAGIYNLEIVFDTTRLARRLAIATTIATLLSVLFFYLLAGDINPKTNLAFVAILAAGATYSWRSLYARRAIHNRAKTGVAFIGETGVAALELMEDPMALSRLGYQLAPAPAAPAAVTDEDLAAQISQLETGVAAGDVDLVVITKERKLPEEARRALFRFLERGIHYVSLPEFYELIFRRVPLGLIDETWFLENIDMAAKRPYLALKRAVDILVAAVAIAVSGALWPLIALAILAESRGSIFFLQTRLGRGGRPFRILKFRTMRMERNDLSPTAKGDSRVTHIGAFLRATRLDELPQTLNILRGDMSFVGPRPERPDLAAELEKTVPYFRQRLLVKPGLTGWDQVSGEYHSPSFEDTWKKLQFDLYYVKNCSLALDVSIFFKTILTVLMRSGR